MRPLTKTTIVFWSEEEPCSSLEFVDIGRELDTGEFRCAHMISEKIENPEQDEHWDPEGEEFFREEDWDSEGEED